MSSIDVHLHAVDHRLEIRALQSEAAHRLRELGASLVNASRIKLVEIGAPFVELPAAFVAVAFFVGDVVHRAAKGVDREHGVAALRLQNAHREIEGAFARGRA